MNSSDRIEVSALVRRIAKSGYIYFGIPVFFALSFVLCALLSLLSVHHAHLAVLGAVLVTPVAALAVRLVVRRAPLLGVPDRYIMVQTALSLGRSTRHLRLSPDGYRVYRLSEGHRSLCGESLDHAHDLDSPKVRRTRRKHLAAVCSDCVTAYDQACAPPAGIAWDSAR